MTGSSRPGGRAGRRSRATLGRRPASLTATACRTPFAYRGTAAGEGAP
ncbi:DUF6380 family protein [Streptomyces sp. NPDC008313]